MLHIEMCLKLGMVQMSQGSSSLNVMILNEISFRQAVEKGKEIAV